MAKSISVYYKGDIQRWRDDQIRARMGESRWYASGVELASGIRDNGFDVTDRSAAKRRASKLKREGLIDSFRFMN